MFTERGFEDSALVEQRQWLLLGTHGGGIEVTLPLGEVFPPADARLVLSAGLHAGHAGAAVERQPNSAASPGVPGQRPSAPLSSG